MNLKEEERILIKDIFNVAVCSADASGSTLLLEQFPKEIGKLGPNVSLITQTTYFDSLLMERLQMPGTDILTYLEQCLSKCHYVIEKPWNLNQLSQQFIKYSIEIIRNFIFLSLQEQDLFPEQTIIDANASKVPDKMISIAMKLMTHFEGRGLNRELIDIIYPKINDEVESKTQFCEAFLDVLLARQRFQTILESKAYTYLTILQEIMVVPDFKKQFLVMPKFQFVPSKLTDNSGAILDTQTPLGLFVRVSILGMNGGAYFHQEREAIQRFEERTIAEFGKEQFDRAKFKYFGNLQNEMNTKLTDVFKIFLKKDSQKQFFSWIQAAIVCNQQRAKLGSRLANSDLNNLSHDGFMLNIYMCLVNLCKVFLNRDNDLYKKIDPDYFMCSHHVKMCKYDPMNSKEENKGKKMDIEKEFGNTTLFFFMCLEVMHVGVITTQDNLVEYLEYETKVKKEKQKLPPNHPYQKKIDNELMKIKAKTIKYYVVLIDDYIIDSSIQLFDMVLFLLPKWLKFDYDELVDCKIAHYKLPELAYYLPEHLVNSIFKFHFTNFRFKHNYLNQLGEAHVSQIVNLTCLLLSEVEIISNPYVTANYLKLLFYFLYETKSGVMSQVFRTNRTAQRNLTFGMIKFYCDIAVTGSSHQFYSKFEYRLYANKIFSTLWVHEVYRDNLKNYFRTPIFEKFLNMVMTDTTYCFDETNETYEKYTELESKKQRTELSNEEKEEFQRSSSIMSSTLQQSTSNLKLMKELSAWSPNTFLSEAERTTVVPLLNNILKTFVDPGSFAANPQLLSQYKFDKALVLSDLLNIYVNLDINQKVSNEIVKDTRNYKREYFTKALQKASNEHYTSINVLERFQNLIGKISTAIHQQDYEEIFGEIPDKYLCALMSTLMKDPVLLPGGNIVDRVNIQRSLLIDERDPFTRAPLKLVDVKEQKTLQLEIEEWKKKRFEELKKGDKELKYGKIGEKQKEDNSEDIFGENRILKYDDKEQT